MRQTKANPEVQEKKDLQERADTESTSHTQVFSDPDHPDGTYKGGETVAATYQPEVLGKSQCCGGEGDHGR